MSARKSFSVRVPASFRRGVAIIYVLVIFTMLCGLGSLAIDLGHAQLVKTELHRLADATAHDYIELYYIGGTPYANTNGPLTSSSSNNPVDIGNGTQPTVTVTWGYWNSATKTFSATPGGSTAVKVTASCTAANSNAVPLFFASMLGSRSADISVSSIAASVAQPSTAVNIPATSDLYLAGMPSGTTTIYGDTTFANGATQVTTIPVTPGTYLTFTNFTGTSTVLPGYMPYFGVQGANNTPNGTAIHHGQNWDGGLAASGYSENGIADAVMPESALVGLFLGSTEPDLNAAPASIDWTSGTLSNQASYTSLQLQQPFLIGTGLTSGSVVKKFLVPTGATRFYVGLWDGVDNNNDAGTDAGTITVANTIQIVQ